MHRLANIGYSWWFHVSSHVYPPVHSHYTSQVDVSGSTYSVLHAHLAPLGTLLVNMQEHNVLVGVPEGTWLGHLLKPKFLHLPLQSSQYLLSVQ